MRKIIAKGAYMFLTLLALPFLAFPLFIEAGDRGAEKVANYFATFNEKVQEDDDFFNMMSKVIICVVIVIAIILFVDIALRFLRF